MTLNEIKAAVDAGKTVHWANHAYTVIKDRIGQYLITHNDGFRKSYIGLIHADDVALNGHPDQFYMAT